MIWVVYVLECADGSLYTGVTNNLERRLNAHATGRGAKYTKHRGPFIVRYTESLDGKGAALQREAAIKALDRAAKVALIAHPSRHTIQSSDTDEAEKKSNTTRP